MPLNTLVWEMLFFVIAHDLPGPFWLDQTKNDDTVRHEKWNKMQQQQQQQQQEPSIPRTMFRATPAKLQSSYPHCANGTCAAGEWRLPWLQFLALQTTVDIWGFKGRVVKPWVENCNAGYILLWHCEVSWVSFKLCCDAAYGICLYNFSAYFLGLEEWVFRGRSTSHFSQLVISWHYFHDKQIELQLWQDEFWGWVHLVTGCPKAHRGTASAGVT